ncbi:MAG: hypothetical protein ABWY78_08710, partial [Microvirga sp.]
MNIMPDNRRVPIAWHALEPRLADTSAILVATSSSTFSVIAVAKGRAGLRRSRDRRRNAEQQRPAPPTADHRSVYPAAGLLALSDVTS